MHNTLSLVLLSTLCAGLLVSCAEPPDDGFARAGGEPPGDPPTTEPDLPTSYDVPFDDVSGPVMVWWNGELTLSVDAVVLLTGWGPVIMARGDMSCAQYRFFLEQTLDDQPDDMALLRASAFPDWERGDLFLPLAGPDEELVDPAALSTAATVRWGDTWVEPELFAASYTEYSATRVVGELRTSGPYESGSSEQEGELLVQFDLPYCDDSDFGG